MKSEKKGFTLVELLITMSIIGVLVSIVAGGYRSSQSRGRDAQRKSDLKQVAASLEVYYSDYGKYPDEIFIDWGDEFTDGKTIYFKQLPVEPVSNHSYLYRVFNGNQKYQIFAYLENSQDKDINPDVVADARSCGAKVCNYGVTSTNSSPDED